MRINRGKAVIVAPLPLLMPEPLWLVQHIPEFFQLYPDGPHGSKAPSIRLW